MAEGQAIMVDAVHAQRSRVRDLATLGDYWSEATIDTLWRARRYIWLGPQRPGKSYYLANDGRIYCSLGKLRLFWGWPLEPDFYMSLVRIEQLAIDELSWLQRQLAELEDRITPARVFTYGS